MAAPTGSTPTGRSPPARGEVLAEQGRLLLEIGPTQADAVADILRAAGLKPEAIVPDLAGRPRVVVAGL